ncbi:MAG: TatD family deoxyribonuclease [Kosmotoga sp.]|nr:MAG: TatD family deoxyribonuclease [Kosmotoga sp.]
MRLFMTETYSTLKQMRDINVCDTHAHINFSHFDKDREEILRDIDERFDFVVEVGIDIDASADANKLAEKNRKVYSSIGIHPHDVSSAGKNYREELEELSKHKKVVAIGEIGLDYYRDISPRRTQRIMFAEQLEFSMEKKLPVIIHVRDAYDDALEILESFAGNINGVVHAFSGDKYSAEKIVSMGFKIGIGGPVTYKKNNELREAVKSTDIKFLLPETDCPFLPPQPFRGKRNQPVYIEHIIRKIAEIKEIDVTECSKKLCDNGRELFGIKV